MAIKKSKLRFLISAIFLVILFVVAFYLSRWIATDDILKNWIYSYGYIAALIVGIIASFNFVVPFPAIIFVPIFLSAGLDFFVVVTILAVGMTIVDGIEYYVSESGWEAANNPQTLKTKNRLHIWKQKHPTLPLIVLFLYTAFAPTPNELSLPLFASLGYRVITVMATTFFGNLIFNIIYSIGIIKIFSII